MRFRFRTLALMLLVGVAIGVAIDRLLRANEVRSSPLMTSATPAEAVNVERILPEICLENVPLDQAAKQLEIISGVAIWVDAASFDKSALKPSVPVFAHLRDATLAETLDAVTSSVGDYYPYLIWYPDGQHITVAYYQRRPPLLTRIYDVSEILSNGRVLKAPSEDVVRYPSSFQPNPPPRPGDDLKRFVTNSIEPYTWSGSGSGPGSMTVIGNVLVVHQTWQVHRKLQAHLAQLQNMIRDQGLQAKNARLSSRVERWDNDLNAWISTSPESVEAALERPVPEYRVKNVTVLQALEELGRATGVRFEVDIPWGKGACDFYHATLEMRGATGFDILEAILAAADREAKRLAPKQREWISILDWTIDNGLVVIANPQHTSRLRPVTRIYDVRDLLRKLPAGDSDPTYRLLSLLHEHAESWNGDNVMLEPDGFLAISETYANHRQIRSALATFRRREGVATTQPGRLP